MSNKRSKLELRNRVVERRRMKAADILPNPRNWREHPEEQSSALAGILEEVGQVGELYAYHSARNGGQLTMLDGHLRQADWGEQEWDIAITDLDDAEADKLLVARDPIASLAATNQAALDDLLDDLSAQTDGLATLFAGLSGKRGSESIEEFQVKRPPALIWYLIGVPLDSFGDAQQHIAALESLSLISVQSSRGNEQ
jgi:hypothetical protein